MYVKILTRPHPPAEGAGTRRRGADSRLASHTPAHKDAARRREQAPAAGAGAHIDLV